MKLPSIALVGNAPQDKCDLLNNMLREDDLTDLCSITLYGADGQPEQEALHDALEDQKKGIIQETLVNYLLYTSLCPMIKIESLLSRNVNKYMNKR